MTVLHVPNADVPPQDRSAGPAAAPGPDLREDLLRYAELGGFTLATETHAWYAAAATVTGLEEARAASTALAEVRGGDLKGAQAAATLLASQAALREPASVAEVTALVALLRRVLITATTLRGGAYEADLDELAAATASGTWRRERGLKLSWGRRRKLRAEARRLAVADRPRRDALHAALVAAAAEREEWAALAPSDTTSAAKPVDAELLEVTAQAAEALVTGLRELGRLLPDHDLTALGFGELADLVDALAADEGTLYKLPELRSLRTALEAGGLDDLLAELADAHADRTAAEAAYRRHTGDADAARQALAGGPREAGDDEPTAPVVAEEVAEVEPVAEVEVEVAEPAVEAAEVEAIAEVAEAPEPETEPVAEVATITEAEPVVEAEPEAVIATDVEPAEAVAEVEPEPEPEAAPAPVAEAEVQPEPIAEPETEPEPAPAAEIETEIAAEVTPEPAPEPEAAPAPEQSTTAKRSRRPRKPELTPGRPVTAYAAEELTALVRWIDSDAEERTEDELLRAAMKELGFARLGPRIKEALGAAVTEARTADSQS